MVSKPKGFKEAISLLQRLPNEMKKTVMTDALRDGTDVVYRDVLSNVPYHKGKQSKASQTYGSILENIRMFKLKVGVPPNSVIFRISVGDSFWGYFLEYGTRFIAAMPWFRPKVDSNMPKAKRVIVQKLNDGFKVAVAKLMRS